MTTTTDHATNDTERAVYAALPSGRRVGAQRDGTGRIHVWFTNGGSIGIYNADRIPGPLTASSLVRMLTGGAS